MQAPNSNKQTAGKMILLGIQHVFAMFGSTVLVPILTGMDPSMALLCAGIGTLIFHLVTKGKVPAFLGSSFAFIAAICAVAADMSGGAAVGTPEYFEGLRYACGGIVVAGGLYLVMSCLVMIFGADKIRSFFPPLVTGAIVIVIGLMLAPTAINNITTATNPATGATETLTGGALWINWLIAAVTIGAMFAVSIAGKGFFKLVPILIGIAVGYIVTLICQLCGANIFGQPLVDFTALNENGWFQMPRFQTPLFNLKSILTIAPLAIVTFVEHIGDMQANGAVVGQDFIKDPGLHRTLLGDGLATMVAGLLGGPANTTYSENTGVLAATKNYNPATLRLAAVFAIVIAFCGKISAFLQTLPSAVMGGVSIILFGMIAAVGLRTLVENQVDFKSSRNLMIIAIMLVLGLGGAAIHISLGDSGAIEFSGSALAAIVGIVLNKVIPERPDDTPPSDTPQPAKKEENYKF